MLLKRLGVRRIIAKAGNELHGSILRQVGATRVVFPERDTGVRVAHSFSAPGVQRLPGRGAGLRRGARARRRAVRRAQPERPEPARDVRRHRRGAAPRRSGAVNPDPSEVVRTGDELIVLGSRTKTSSACPAPPTEPPTQPILIGSSGHW